MSRGICPDGDVTDPILNAVTEPQVKIGPSPGIVVLAGLDVRIWRSVYSRLDVSSSA